MNIIIQPDVLIDLKNNLTSINKNAVRFDIANFG